MSDAPEKCRRPHYTSDQRNLQRNWLRLLSAVDDQDLALRRRVLRLQGRGLSADLASELLKIFSANFAQMRGLLEARYSADLYGDDQNIGENNHGR